MRELREAERLRPSTGSIVEEAASRGIPWIRLNKYSLCRLGYGANQKRIQTTAHGGAVVIEEVGDAEPHADVARDTVADVEIAQ